MSTKIRPEVSTKNPYYISRHRYYELKHFCLQYDEWKQLYLEKENEIQKIPGVKNSENVFDPTGETAVSLADLRRKIDIVEQCAYEAGGYIGEYLLKAVTKNLSYLQLYMMDEIPCSKDAYYVIYRRFFWILDKKNN